MQTEVIVTCNAGQYLKVICHLLCHFVSKYQVPSLKSVWQSVFTYEVFAARELCDIVTLTS